MLTAGTNERRSIARFGLAGIANTATDWTTYYLVGPLAGLNDTGAKALGVLAGISMAYVMNSRWVFRSSFDSVLRDAESRRRRAVLHAKSYLLMMAAYGVGMASNVGAFWVVSQATEIRIIALAAATAVSMVINYSLSRRIFGMVVRKQTSVEPSNGDDTRGQDSE